MKCALHQSLSRARVTGDDVVPPLPSNAHAQQVVVLQSRRGGPLDLAQEHAVVDRCRLSSAIPRPFRPTTFDAATGADLVADHAQDLGQRVVDGERLADPVDGPAEHGVSQVASLWQAPQRWEHGRAEAVQLKFGAVACGPRHHLVVDPQPPNAEYVRIALDEFLCHWCRHDLLNGAARHDGPFRQRRRRCGAHRPACQRRGDQGGVACPA
mmetsp:Transcript_82812/g.184891  ORF Transcript_82812/g.184891 Transcript_82812/m.184891 type:complete len:211 (-) Transcript_82812:2-634(-)